MPTVPTDFGAGGRHLVPGSGSPTLREVLASIVVDMAALRTAIVGITAQLDSDAGVTDTDYAANNDPAALTTVIA